MVNSISIETIVKYNDVDKEKRQNLILSHTNVNDLPDKMIF